MDYLQMKLKAALDGAATLTPPAPPPEPPVFEVSMPPPTVVVQDGPVYQWKMVPHRDSSGLIESITLTPVRRVEVPK